ncbi:MAG: 50S ribosomal protein L21 [Alphaproteobacteria bacterium]|nr:50S ribosomal protein L21 [Alphaproteobacteria bacterium]OJV16242.1 MAG: 50S ribosomal protein L21 [Alphaproteobacteria bacterium 33-17]
MNNNFYAIFRSGNKQYKVNTNDVVKLEKIAGNPGAEVKLDDVLMIGNHSNGSIVIGNPVIDGAYVKAEIISQEKDKKIIVFKKQRRQHYRRKNGHRQQVTFVRITDIAAN